ncbi:MAG: transglycosylase domain-containing protein, partial [Chitinophagales bacterium]|nr:transglycosylase domain-containing protein [Chitinophagales bacterium]
KHRQISRNLKIGISSLLILLILFFILPIPNNKPTFSKQLYSADHELISAIVSSEQQWCFPMDEAIPEHLKTCIVLYEDEYIKYHPGVNPISIIKAFFANKQAKRTVRGASTLAMQVMRMRNNNAKRSWSNKIQETVSALKYSLLNRDQTIIRDWCEIAPFGGNTIGIKAAALRYFNRPLDKLSWAEYALLTVMPNGPSTANLTKNRDKLKQKRDLLLKKLNRKGYLNHADLELYLDEDLPEVLREIPQSAYHLLLFLSKKYPDKNIFHTTIQKSIQENTMELLNREGTFLQIDDINNLAAVVIDVQTNQLVAYHGNIRNRQNKFSYVDIVQSPRSYGSLLKPLLYASALDRGLFLPYELVADIPTAIGDFQPKNFDKKYRGAVPLSDILLQSLNVPAVRLLNYTGLQYFYDLISQLNLAYLNRGADHYGLSIILGGGESSLWDLTRLYKGFAQNYLGFPNPYGAVQTLQEEAKQDSKVNLKFSAFAIDYTVKTMADLTRPREEKSWDLYENNYKIAWKTGTSYGHKDAWAIGFNGKYAVGV